MEALDTALIILVAIWSIIFLVLGIALIIFLRQVKLALDKVNRILQNAEDFTEDVGVPVRAVSATISRFLSHRSAAARKTLKKD